MASNPHSDFTTQSTPCQPSATCQFSPHLTNHHHLPPDLSLWARISALKEMLPLDFRNFTQPPSLRQFKKSLFPSAWITALTRSASASVTKGLNKSEKSESFISLVHTVLPPLEKSSKFGERLSISQENTPPCSGDSGSLLKVDIECLVILATLAFLMAGGQNIRPNSFFISRKHWWLPDTTIAWDRRLKEFLPYIVLLDWDSERYGLYRNPHYRRQVKRKILED